MYGCQCTKRLFLHKHKPKLRNPRDEQQQAIFDAGTSVGELARQLFKGGIDASPPDFFSWPVSIKKTQALIARGEDIIYEAAFQYEGVLCVLDILVKQGKHWYAFEVKSTTSAKEQHIQDAALQYYVLTNSGLPLQDISVIFLNNQYVRRGDLEIHHLFTTESVLESVVARQESIAIKIQELKALLAQRIEPLIGIGPHCFDPYECDFTGHCWSHMPKENSVFDLARGPGWKLYAEGYKHLNEIPETYEMNETAHMQLVHHRSGEVHTDREALQQFLKPLTYPLYFLDFETMMPGIPAYDESRPYQQIPFQFSLHVQQKEEAAIKHHEFLGDGINDPRPQFVEALLEQIGPSGSILCYNMSFEKSRIKELAELYPQHADTLLAMNERIVDLMIPFQQRMYYHPEFKGSYSIKAVLPVLIPSLRYHDLLIQEGGMASLVYSQLHIQNKTTAEIQRQALLDYCRMDTFAMVKILEYLKSV
jgi:Domain of unknown function(DUF2779)